VIGAVSCAGDAQSGESKPERSENQGGYLGSGRFQLTISYRHLYSFRHFVGTQEQYIREQLQTQVVNKINLETLQLSYQATPRWSVNAIVPVLFATRHIPGAALDEFLHYTNAPDQNTRTSGFGDVILTAQTWLWHPPTESGGNIAIGLGVKHPTGKNNVFQSVNTINGPTVQAIDSSIQPGDGAWGIVGQMQGFKTVKKAVLFMDGTYVAEPQNTNAVPTGQKGLNAFYSTPDQYLAEAGIAYPFPKVRGLVVTFGPHIEGVKVRDLFGKSEGFRRPGYALSMEPGVEYSRRRSIVTFNVLKALVRDRARSVPDIANGTHGDAAFADYVWLLNYTYRF
jgi:hypothetical protein